MTTALDSSRVKALRVLPPLGIARIGNCEDSSDPFADDFLISPEVVGGPPSTAGGRPASTIGDFRDGKGAIRRQAARFRVYATLDDGSVTEVTSGNGIEIEWRVSLANLKAGWYEFNQAMDLPAGLAKDANRRNAGIPILPGGRTSLDIVPTPRNISGSAKKGNAFQFADGLFCGQRVYLGELRTDVDGRLLVLGGRGLSASYPPKRRPITFANNEGWHDDVGDGPVRATVRFPDGSAREADPGYVAVTPPNFAPGLIGLVTMDDTVRELFMRQGWLPRPTTTSFTSDIWPIFKRLSDLQWVNQGLFMVHGHGGPLDPDSSDVMLRLRDASIAGGSWRKSVFALFRCDPDLTTPDIGQLPQIYGDAEGEVADPACLAVTSTQYGHLERWAAGNFADDWTGSPVRPVGLASLSPDRQVEQLERAALHDCLGGPFHPGIELTWTMRIPHLWTAPYRLNVLPTNASARQDWGDVLTPAVCIGRGGPYDGVAAGALTRFLGVPWQTDGASCNSEADYHPSYFLSMPTFWGARVPDQVLSSESHLRAVANIDLGCPTQAMKYFATRSDWLRDVRGVDYYDRIAHMIVEWHDLGMVLPAPVPMAGMPDPIRTEQGRSEDYVKGDVKPALLATLESPPSQTRALLAAAPSLATAVSPPQGHTRRSYRQGEI